MRTVILSFTHKDNEIYKAVDGEKKVFEYIKEGYPIRSSFYDKEAGVVCINFGSKGSILLTEDERV